MSAVEPRVLKADGSSTEDGAVRAAVQSLARGQLVVLPTDTVYGLACRADDRAAVQRLFAAKRRKLTKPLPLLLANAQSLSDVAVALDEAVWRLARSFWPGPLTLVVPKSAAVSDAVTAGQPTVGVRVPDLPLTRAILRAAPFAVAVTSANLSADAPACAVGDLPAELLQQIALIIDSGPCVGMKPSTVVDATVTPLRILREGPVTAEQIQAALSASL